MAILNSKFMGDSTMTATVVSEQRERDRARTIGAFFQGRREQAQVSAEHVAAALGLESTELLLAYESGAKPLPLDEIFALTNVLNIPPEDVLGLIYDLSFASGTTTR